MIEKFIKTLIPNSKFRIIQHTTGKDNITYEVIYEDGTFIVQQLSNPKSDKNKDFIEKVIQYVDRNIHNIHFSNKKFTHRFYEYGGFQFQVMEKIEGESINPTEIDKEIIIKTSQYLSYFHSGMRGFDCDKFSDINDYKKLNIYKKIAHKYVKSSLDKEIIKVFEDMYYYATGLQENYELPRGVIHGDPSFKNFLISDSYEIQGLIDYDMISVNTILWDIADMIRGYLKLDIFDKKTFHLLLESYTQIRELSVLEEKELQNYCKMMVLDTGFRYIISYFENSNLLGDSQDCLKKAQRCIKDFRKIEVLFS